MTTSGKLAIFLVAMMLCLGSSQSMAEEAGAILMEVTGDVLVNQGKVYQRAQSGVKLPVNTRVLTKDTASAVITSKQGCVTRLDANSLFVVKALDPCHGGGGAIESTGTGCAVALGAFGDPCSACTAATLTKSEGVVLVSEGGEYRPGQLGMKLTQNTRVLTKDKSSAVVTSRLGCATSMGANSGFVVKLPDPCHGGSSVVRPANEFGGMEAAGGFPSAATLTKTEGSVLVSRAGKAYRPAQLGMKLTEHDRVLTRGKSGAVVTSESGCATSLNANSVFVVELPDPCHGGAAAALPVGPACPVATVAGAGLSAANWGAIGLAGAAAGTSLIGLGGGLFGPGELSVPISPVAPNPPL
jgi:hypothetical protein